MATRVAVQPYDAQDETCWLGGECENPPDYDITHGYEGLYIETHGICSHHIAEAVDNLSRPVAGWGDPLPLKIVRRSTKKGL